MTDRDILLFSYGTLQLESVQLSSFGRRLDGEPDAMTGYARTMVEITDPDVLAASGERFHPIVSPSSDHTLSGRVENEVRPSSAKRISLRKLHLV